MNRGGRDMFLTKKDFRKIAGMAICYLVLGGGCFVLAVVFNGMGIDVTLFVVLGIVAYALCPLLILWGRYAEGKGKWIALGNKLVRHDLKPAEFIETYETLKNSKDLVIRKPSVEVLQLVAIAYDSLNDRENCLSAVDEMIAVAGEKKKAYIKLLKTSFLFSWGKMEEAEALFAEIQGQKLNAICNLLADAVLKSDRAMAMGDYRVVEAHSLKTLAQTFPKLDSLGKLTIHYKLGEVYEKLGDTEKAILYYQYCADFGGETEIRASAKFALKRLQ